MKEETMDDHNSEHDCWECGEAIAVGADMVEALRIVDDEATPIMGLVEEPEVALHMHAECWESLMRTLRRPRWVGGPGRQRVTYRSTSRGPNVCACQECQSGRVVEALRGSLAGAA